MSGVLCMHSVRATAVTLVMTSAALLPISAIDAQDTPPSAWARGHDVNAAATSSAVAWLGAWSPLRPIADMPRGMLRAPLAPGLLDAPAPMAGAFMLSGAPGSLARDLSPRMNGDTARFSDLRVRVASDAGDFRRPLDIAETRVTQFSGVGWSPVGARTVVIGRIVIDRENIDQSSFSELLAPYRSSPFVDTDSVTPPMGRSRARFEGAIGLRLGGFGAGVSAGVESREHSTVEFPLRRGGRAATPAIAAGLERVLPWLDARVGAYYRWSEPVETYLLSVNPLQTTLYALQGYDEPAGLAVTSLPVFARVERRTTAVGGTLEATALNARIVLTHEQGDRAEDQNRNPTNPVRPTDRWRATGSETRLMVQRMFGTRIRGTLVGSMESLEGEAVRSDLEGLAFDGSDERMAVEADVRVSLTPRWSAAVIGGATRVSSEREDYVALASSEITSATPFVALEAARRFGIGALSVGVSAAVAGPTGRVPGVSERGPNYQRIIAPALAYDAAEARATSAWLTGLLPVRDRTLIGSVRMEQTSPTSVAASRLQPGGNRSGWSVSFGLR